MKLSFFWSSEDNAYTAETPELPGCMVDGKTNQEALAIAEQIIEKWIETAIKLGRPIPQPRGRLAYA
jgi:predicted RNase H-like HicB family nuclease